MAAHTENKLRSLNLLFSCMERKIVHVGTEKIVTLYTVLITQVYVESEGFSFTFIDAEEYVAPAQPGEIGSLESIPRLLKSLKIRALSSLCPKGGNVLYNVHVLVHYQIVTLLVIKMSADDYIAIHRMT